MEHGNRMRLEGEPMDRTRRSITNVVLFACGIIRLTAAAILIAGVIYEPIAFAASVIALGLIALSLILSGGAALAYFVEGNPDD